MTDSSSQMMIDSLKPWFHNIHLPDGTQTAPDHPLGDFPGNKWQTIEPLLPKNLEGWTVLDMGCNAGFYTIKFAQRGANVVAVDNDSHHIAQARWAVSQFNLSRHCDLRQMPIYDVAQIRDTFDLVCFMGVFHRLRYPLLGLDLAARKASQLMMFQSMMLPGEEVINSAQCDRATLLHPAWPKMAFVENSLPGDPATCWIPNRAAIEVMLRSAGMNIIARTGPETFFCERVQPAEPTDLAAAAGAAEP